NPPESQRLVPAQPGDPQFNDEYYPRILQVGDDIAIISYRFPNVTTKPDGTASSSSTYLWLSTDGGNSFSGPALVGDQEPSGDAVVFGPPDSPRIGLISDTETGGTFFQSLSPGVFTSAKANLDEGDGNRAYGGTLAAVGGGLAAAFADASGRGYVRTWAGAGDPNDPASWTPSQPPFTGSEPRLASGPSGSYLMSRAGLLGSAPLEVRRLIGTSLGPATRVSDTASAGRHVLIEDPGGTLFASWVNRDRPDVRLRTSLGGTRWSADQVLAAGGQSLDQIALGATFDSGGFATWVRNGTGVFGNGTIQAVPFGNQGPTGRLGLGSLPGGSADPSVVESCQRIAFGVVSILAQQGCFLTAAGQNGVRVSDGPIRINGVDVIPDPGTRILINARARTIDTIGPVSIRLTPIGDTAVEIFHGELHTKVPREGALASAADGPSPHGTVLASFDTKTFPVNLKGFPVQGNIAVELIPGGTQIPISLELPKVFGGVTGDAELVTSEAEGLKLKSLHIEAKTIPIGPIFIDDLLIDYKGGSEDTWTGGATLVLPPPGAGAHIGAQVTFKAGAFKQGSIVLSPPYPGIGIAPATFLSDVGGGFGVDPLSIVVRGHIGTFPLAPPNSYTIGVTGTMTVTFGNPVTFELDGKGDVADVKLETAHVLANTDGYIHVNGSAEIDLDVLTANGDLDAFVDGQKQQFAGRIAGKVCIGGVCAAGGEAVVSSNGIGACVTEVISYGFGYHWGDPLTSAKVMVGSCDLTPYTIPAPGAAREAQGPRFTVRPGTALASVKLTGVGGAPTVTLVPPSGQSVVPVAPGAAATGASAFALQVPAQSATYIALRHPAPGSWSVETTPGSPAIAQLALATAQPAPTVAARVSGRGARRALAYRVAGGSGLRVTFSELVGGEGSHLIGSTSSARGVIRFTPSYGPGGRRQIEALIERDGLPRARVMVATYVAPAPQRPGRVTGLRISRRGAVLRASWKPVAQTTFYLVRVTLSNGRRLVRVVGSRTRSLTLTGIAGSVRASVTVSAGDAHGRSGPPASARG
ncbi:MAG TPA: hypothetical protein VMU39_10825, partial [Solirubrobacteraceae bacterium]|nr:hypothetical protein [Solirubrobacteraceae bacterium]